MITFGSFILGTFLFILGLSMVVRTDLYLRFLGDVSQLFGALGIPWLSWKLFGLITMCGGFFIAFGIFGLIIQETIGRLF